MRQERSGLGVYSYHAPRHGVLDGALNMGIGKEQWRDRDCEKYVAADSFSFARSGQVKKQGNANCVGAALCLRIPHVILAWVRCLGEPSIQRE